MSLHSVQQFFAQYAADIAIIHSSSSTATVHLAAEVHGVEPGQIAKTLSLRVGDKALLVVTRGDVRLDNKKLRHVFGGKAKMLDAESVLALTGHRGGRGLSVWTGNGTAGLLRYIVTRFRGRHACGRFCQFDRSHRARTPGKPGQGVVGGRLAGKPTGVICFWAHRATAAR